MTGGAKSGGFSGLKGGEEQELRNRNDYEETFDRRRASAQVAAQEKSCFKIALAIDAKS